MRDASSKGMTSLFLIHSACLTGVTLSQTVKMELQLQ